MTHKKQNQQKTTPAETGTDVTPGIAAAAAKEDSQTVPIVADSPSEASARSDHTVANAASVSTGEETSQTGIVSAEAVVVNRSSNGLAAAECGCPGNGSSPLLYAIGTLAYDFGNEARRDGFFNQMPPVNKDGLPATADSKEMHPANPYDVRQMVNYLAGVPKTDKYPGFKGHPSEAQELIWTLNHELTPLYVIDPQGAFAEEAYGRLVSFLKAQAEPMDSEDYIERISLPGKLSGRKKRLFSGQQVSVVKAGLRGMYGWAVGDLLKDLGIEPSDPRYNSVRELLNRIYFDLANLGQTSSERALNFAATNAFQFNHIYDRDNPMVLDRIGVEKSIFCRLDSDCWEVKLVFFDSENVLRAKQVVRFTVDVSEALPVLLGDPRRWSVA